MPIYVYSCVCGKQFDKLVRKMDSDDTATCPECGKEAEKIVAPVSPFQWGRGGGW